MFDLGFAPVVGCADGMGGEDAGERGILRYCMKE